MNREPLSAALPRHDIVRFLQSLFHDPGALSSITIEAFAVTAASLYGWCDPADVDAALAMISMPVPKCLHNRPWDKCAECGAERQINAAN